MIITRLNSKRGFSVKSNKVVYIKEDPLITQILQSLSNIRIKAWRNNTTGIYDVKKKKWKKFHNQLTGVSDILGVLPKCGLMQGGRSLAIECKTENDKPSKEQIIFINDINEIGGVGLFVRHPNDVFERLDKEGYIKWDRYRVQRNY